MDKFQDIKNNLRNRRKEIVERLDRVESHLRHTEKPLDDDFAEQAVERANDQVLEALDTNMRAEVIKIDHALTLIDKGKYGFCENCREAISEKRLAALPFANLCINCAS